jgi:hypothetical protein
VPGAGVVNNPGGTPSTPMHAHADDDGPVNGVIHNFSPGLPRDIVLD